MEIKQLPQLPISGSKKLTFTLMMLLLPILLLLLVEIVLEFANYGGDIDLVLTQEINETTYCYINKQAAKRFFSNRNIHVPGARTAVFKKEKSADTYRIFCLGGSTTAGFPFQYNATFPSLLNDRLDVLFPDKKNEVINVGISAINSYSVLDFCQELVQYEPDLFLIYMGHNEFYGALGIGSTQRIGQNRNWVLFYMQLQKIRLFNLVRDLVGWIQNLFVKTTIQPEAQTLMEKVVQNRYIELNSPTYKIALDYFEKNLEEIILLTQKSGAKVIASTLVSNLADQEPFANQYSTGLKEIQRKRWQRYLETGYELEKAKKPNEALVQYHKAENIDNLPAELYYRRAKCLQVTGNASIARKDYLCAKDRDVLRFRASSDFNRIIQAVGKRHNIPVIDMEKVFAPYCQDEILDKYLFTDHLHPSFPGYFWMAKAFSEEMAKSGCIVPAEKWEWGRGKTTAEYRQMAGVTDLDLEIASQRIRKLTVRWPFKHEVVLRKNSGSEYDDLLEKTVTELLQRKYGWNAAHYKMAKFFKKNQDYERAAREYEAVIKVTPYNYFPYLELANIRMRQTKYQQAEDMLKNGLKYSPNLPFIYAKLGMLYCFTNKFTAAIQRLEQAIEINRRTKHFKNEELAGAHYLLSVAYTRTGKREPAIHAAEMALQLKPNYSDAKALLKQLKMKE